MGALLVRIVEGIARLWAAVRDATRRFLTPSYRFAVPDPQLERWARARTLATVASLVVVHLVWGDVVDWVSRGIGDYVAGITLAVVLGSLALLIASGVVVAVAPSGRRRRQTAHLGLPLSRLAGVWGGLTVVVLGLTGLTRLVSRGMGAGAGLAGVLAVLAGLVLVAVAAIALLAFVVTAATAITRHYYCAVDAHPALRALTELLTSVLVLAYGITAAAQDGGSDLPPALGVLVSVVGPLAVAGLAVEELRRLHARGHLLRYVPGP
jgi:hypothetical protein